MAIINIKDCKVKMAPGATFHMSQEEFNRRYMNIPSPKTTGETHFERKIPLTSDDSGGRMSAAGTTSANGGDAMIHTSRRELDVNIIQLAHMDSSYDEQKIKEFVDFMKKHGLIRPILVQATASFYTCKDRISDFKVIAAKRLGWSTITADVEFNTADVPEADELLSQLKGNIVMVNDPIEWTHRVRDIMEAHPLHTVRSIADKLGISSTMLLDRLAMLRQHEAAMKKAEEHGRTQGEIALTKAQVEKEHEGVKRMREQVKDAEARQRTSKCSGCKNHVSQSVLAETGGMCVRCANAEAVAAAIPPQQRGLVRCLEAGCKKWIKDPMKRVFPLQATYYYCKEHQVMVFDLEDDVNFRTAVCRSISNMPLYDRDGDPIWVTAQLEVKKIKAMDDSHLTNCLVFLETAAKRRCQITGVDESKWQERVNERYPELVKEAKRRDDKLRCVCKDGVREVKTITEGKTIGPIPAGTVTRVEEVLCTECQLGRDRKAAKETAQKIAAERKGKRQMLTKAALVMVVTLIAAGHLPSGSQVVAWFIGYLREFGCLK